MSADLDREERELALGVGANLGALGVIEKALAKGVEGARDQDLAFKIIRALLSEGMVIVMRYRWYEAEALADAVTTVVRRRTNEGW